MYKEHFALKKPLFGDGIVRDAEVFFGPRQQLVAANLKISLSTRDSITVLTGPMGVGKTTLASHALRSAATRLAMGWLGTAPLTAHELLEQLLSEFDFSPYKSSRVERMQVWRQFLSEMSITDTRVCILVENAQDLEPDVLRALASLTSADPNGCPGANVVLTCPTPLRELLATPGLEPITQRLRLSCRLDPLNVDDVRAYLAHRAERAGTQFDRLFAPNTTKLVHHYSGGIIRVINNLCETALTVAATRKEPVLKPELLMRVAVGLFGMEPTALPTTGNSPAASGAGSAPAAATATPASGTATAAACAPNPKSLPLQNPPVEPVRDAAAQPAARTEATHSTPIVGAAAMATAQMMADEASMASAAERSMDTQPRTTPSAAPVDGPAVAASTIEAASSSLPETEGDDPDGEAGYAELSSPASEPDLIEDVAAENSRIETIPEHRPEAICVDEDADQDAAPHQATFDAEPSSDDAALDGSVIEFVADDHAADPFAVDEKTLTDAVGELDEDERLDLPVLTDSVEAADDEVARAVQATDPIEPSQQADAALASTLAGYDVEDDLPVLDEEAAMPAGETADDESPGQDVVDEAEQQKRDALDALAHAKALEDISNSMAETLFGDAELAELSATLAVTTSDEMDLELELELEDDEVPSRSQAL